MKQAGRVSAKAAAEAADLIAELDRGSSLAELRGEGEKLALYLTDAGEVIYRELEDYRFVGLAESARIMKKFWELTNPPARCDLTNAEGLERWLDLVAAALDEAAYARTILAYSSRIDPKEENA